MPQHDPRTADLCISCLPWTHMLHRSPSQECQLCFLQLSSTKLWQGEIIPGIKRKRRRICQPVHKNPFLKQPSQGASPLCPSERRVLDPSEKLTNALKSGFSLGEAVGGSERRLREGGSLLPEMRLLTGRCRTWRSCPHTP